MLIRNLVRRLGNNHISRLGLSRVLSTSQSKNDTIAADPVGAAQSQAQSNQEENENKGYYSWGFDEEKFYDQTLGHTLFFSLFTVGLIVYPLLYMNRPDYSLENWAHREAYLELNRRESEGLPLVDPNYIDPAKVIIPSDEDLKEQGIRIII
ncbi:NADH dehydrogenase [ubiquinone] 1 beta subcomplex subunit 11, mitochondrial-like [Artemia franciscana]|uniref:NADH dehydrogenase [ubiquinone] 1 beta subcomplex subunit 11, mitochondrial-like n=1 Tax=Artemia franciscana TaxID=6661 RepID=UPI0032D9C4A7